MDKLYFSILIVLSIFIIGCTASNSSEKILSGTLYVSGNEPFANLSVETDDNKYYQIKCSDSLRTELWALQGSKIDLVAEKIEEFDKINYVTVINYKVKGSSDEK